jgi:NADPH2:quinone reductase
MRVIQVNRFGGPEVLEVTDIREPQPARHQILVDVRVAGVNYLDAYQRSGQESAGLTTPFVLGVEGAGQVLQVGSEVEGVRPGDRVAWATTLGSFAEAVLVDAATAVPIPDDISDELACGLLLQGLTAHFLATSAFPIGQGDVALVHAAAGGVGLLLTQMVKLRGGEVIGTVSSDAKARLIRELGADHAIRYDEADFAEIVRDITDGNGVTVVYDSVGRATFEGSLASLSPRGYLVLYGAASGPVAPLDPDRLMAAGSLFLTRPSLLDYTRTREELLERAADVFNWAGADQLKLHVGGRYHFDDVVTAYERLEGRQTAGKLLLVPR